MAMVVLLPEPPAPPAPTTIVFCPDKDWFVWCSKPPAPPPPPDSLVSHHHHHRQPSKHWNPLFHLGGVHVYVVLSDAALRDFTWVPHVYVPVFVVSVIDGKSAVAPAVHLAVRIRLDYLRRTYHDGTQVTMSTR